MSVMGISGAQFTPVAPSVEPTLPFGPGNGEPLKVSEQRSTYWELSELCFQEMNLAITWRSLQSLPIATIATALQDDRSAEGSCPHPPVQ